MRFVLVYFLCFVWCVAGNNAFATSQETTSDAFTSKWFAPKNPYGLPADPLISGTALGGSLFPTGQTTMTCGAGYPEAFCQFDFANARFFNLAAKASITYAHGFEMFGLDLVLSLPMRIGIVQNSRFSMAAKVEPGFFFGGIYHSSFFLGALMKLGVLLSYQVKQKITVNFGVESPMLLSFEPLNNAPGTSFTFPIQFFAGMEYRLNKQFGVFAHVGVGPQFYTGNYAERIQNDPNNSFYPSASFTALAGILYHR